MNARRNASIGEKGIATKSKKSAQEIENAKDSGRRRQKGELSDQDMDQVAGGVRTGDDDDLEDLEIQYIR